jgi:hypothetical protein
MSNTECPICLEAVQDDVNVGITECRHKYHMSCFVKMVLHGEDRCAICRCKQPGVPERSKISSPTGETENDVTITLSVPYMQVRQRRQRYAPRRNPRVRG